MSLISLWTVCQKHNYTIREIAGNCKFTEGAFDAVCECVEFAIKKLDLETEGHLFVTVVGTVALRCGPDPSDFGFGLYQSGLQHITICGSMPEEETDKEWWLRELRKTVMHEIVHYKQDLEGTLGVCVESENEAEQLSERLLVELEAIAK